MTGLRIKSNQHTEIGPQYPLWVKSGYSASKSHVRFTPNSGDGWTTDPQEVPPPCDPLHMRDAADGLCVTLEHSGS